MLPAPHAVAARALERRGLLWHNFAVTAEEVVLGLALALAVGFALAIAIHLSPLLRRAVYPLAVGSQAIPIPLIGVLLVFWWGFGIFPKLVVIALICFFPIVVTTVDGLAAVDPDQPKLLRTLDASRWQAFRFAELPAALPAALSGARIALAVGVIGAFIAETTTPTHRRLSGPRPRDPHGRQLPDRARLRGHGCAVRVRDRLLLCARRRRAPAGPMEHRTRRRSTRDHRDPRRADARRRCSPPRRADRRAAAGGAAAPSRTPLSAPAASRSR